MVLWLKDFISNLSEDPYPVDVAGIYAAEKDDNARNFDSDDEDVFDAYYDKLYEWNERHKEQSLPMSTSSLQVKTWRYPGTTENWSMKMSNFWKPWEESPFQKTTSFPS